MNKDFSCGLSKQAAFEAVQREQDPERFEYLDVVEQ
jgi:hypothetical protein